MLNKYKQEGVYSFNLNIQAKSRLTVQFQRKQNKVLVHHHPLDKCYLKYRTLRGPAALVHLGICQECRISGPATHLLNHNHKVVLRAGSAEVYAVLFSIPIRIFFLVCNIVTYIRRLKMSIHYGVVNYNMTIMLTH